MKSSQLEISRPMVLFHKNPSFRDRSSQAIACYHETKQDGRTNRNDRNVEAKLHLQNKQHLGLSKNSIPPNPLVHHCFSRMQLWRDIYNHFSDQHHFSCWIVLDCRARSPAVLQCIGSSKRFCTCIRVYHISSMRRDFGDGPNVLVLRRLRRFDELNGFM